jgi:probable rRNA maturation factor
MILFDPDLDPDPAPFPARPFAASSLKNLNAAILDKYLRIPTARTLTRFLAAALAAVRLKGQINVLLTTDAAIRRLNRQFRGKNKATDVLSFPAMPIPGIKGAEVFAGDLAISVPTARKQAIAQGHPLATEIKVLILHGLLHLAGYDHETDSGQMARREAKLRAQLKLPLGLIERVGAAKPTAMKLSGKRTAGAKARSVRTSSAARLKSYPDIERGLRP